MEKLADNEKEVMRDLLEEMESILNSTELMRDVDIVGELTRIVEKKYDI